MKRAEATLDLEKLVKPIGPKSEALSPKALKTS